MNALIGSNGLIGSVLAQGIEFDQCYNSANIAALANQTFDTVYCAAPSGNRLQANRDPNWDNKSIDTLIDVLRTVRIGKFVLISTVDAVHAPESVYGGNRLRLEQFAQSNFDVCYVVRLCTLIHSAISKNILFDIKHKQYLDNINGATVRQYYPLTRLCNDIQTVLDNNIREINLVSEPVSDGEICSEFCADVAVSSAPARPYDLHCVEPFGSYIISRQQVLQHISAYIND